MSYEPPQTYAEWIRLIDRFRNGDDSSLEPMNQGSLAWTNVVAERWTRHVSEAFTARLTSVSERLQRELDRSKGEAFAVSQAMLQTRRAIATLSDFARLSVFPDEVRDHLGAELDRWVAETQESLERSASMLREDRGRLLKQIRDNPLNANTSNFPAPGCPEAGISPRTRRIIL